MGLVGAGVSGGLGMAGSLINGFSQAAASKTEARVDRLNAAQAANNANVAIDQGYLNAQKDYQEGSAKLGAQRAQMAANGVTLDSGSALDVQQATGRNTGMTVGSDLYDANARAVAYRNQATSYDNEARAARANASNAITGGAIGGTLAAGSAFASKWDDLFGNDDADNGTDFKNYDYTPGAFGW